MPNTISVKSTHHSFSPERTWPACGPPGIAAVPTACAGSFPAQVLGVRDVPTTISGKSTHHSVSPVRTWPASGPPGIAAVPSASAVSSPVEAPETFGDSVERARTPA